jgi:hypothetical protein
MSVTQNSLKGCDVPLYMWWAIPFQKLDPIHASGRQRTERSKQKQDLKKKKKRKNKTAVYPDVCTFKPQIYRQVSGSERHD